MAQVVGRQPLAVRTLFRSKDSPCEFPGVQGRIATNSPPRGFSLTGGGGGYLPENYALSEVGALWIETFLVFKG
jgi:hypothetical protein